MTHLIVSNKFIDIGNNLSDWYLKTVVGADKNNYKIISIVTVEFENTWITTIIYL